MNQTINTNTITHDINNFKEVFSQDGNETAQNADKLRLNKDPLGNDTSGSAILGDTNGIIYMTNFEANRLWKYYGYHFFLNNSAD